MPGSSRFAVAVHILTMMALNQDEPIKSERAAGSVNTNPVVIRRIMCALSRAQLVVSQTGATGGSRLARKPAEITLLEVYRAVEGEQAFGFQCHAPNNRCLLGKHIPSVLESILQEVDQAVEQVLGRITLDRVMQSVGSSVNTGKQSIKV